jgi:hypothetical protein
MNIRYFFDNFLRRTALYELRALSIDREVLERLE